LPWCQHLLTTRICLPIYWTIKKLENI